MRERALQPAHPIGASQSSAAPSGPSIDDPPPHITLMSACPNFPAPADRLDTTTLRTWNVKDRLARDGECMPVQRRLIGGTTFVVGAIWLAVSFGYLSLSSVALSSLWGVFILLSGISAIFDWRTRKERPLKEPTAAQSARNVILLTGLAAVVLTVENARSVADYGFSALIAIAALTLAFAAYRFASKNADKIGEARFNTKSDGG